MIVIIDYKCGNIASVENIIKKAGSKAIISSDPEIISRASKLILPGVGSFDYGMNQLKEMNLIDIILEHVNKGKYILGICLGMQLLGNKSDEGICNGLSLVDAEVIRFPNDKKLPVPHMGWNKVIVQKKNVLIDENEFNKFYFVHSYYMRCNDPDIILCKTDYGINFVSAISKDNVLGVQFHPEKSHKYGLNLIKKFIAL